jgi:hypothetical protein
MNKTRALTGICSAVLLITLASSARADAVHADMLLEKRIYAEQHHLTVMDIQTAASGYVYAGHFENNNGKHLGFANVGLPSSSGKNIGFAVEAVHRGPSLGIVRPQLPSVSQNPEPASMVLLGSGLAAAVGFARKKSRKRTV